MPISVSSGISSSLAAGVRSSLAVVLARVFQSHYLSLSRSSHFSFKSMQSNFFSMHNYSWLPLTNVLRVYKIIYRQLGSQPVLELVAILVVPKPTQPD